MNNLKCFYRVVAILTVVAILFGGLSFAAKYYDKEPAKSDEMRGVWVATVLNLDYPSKPNTDAAALKTEAITILDNIKSMGFTDVFFQVSPTADTFYKSEIYPWSKYLTGERGLAPTDNFDPLKFWVEKAHERGIKLHAWFNPYRVTRDKNEDISKIKLYQDHPDWIVSHTDGQYYLDPGNPAVIEHIADVVMEVVDNYDIDGVHFDDYFYPGKNFNDSLSYNKYGNGRDLKTFRLDNVNKLIRRVNQDIKANSPETRFGISPFGIWANSSSNPRGSDTRGNESLNSHYADSLAWIKEGIIDYIVPQVYWNIGFEIADYEKLANWWAKAVEGSDVDLYIGMAGYKTNNQNPASAWHGTDEIKRQLDLNATIDNIKGAVHFRYSNYVNSSSLRRLITSSHGHYDSLIKARALVVGRPYKDIRTSASKYFIGGSSNPNKKLFLNGVEIKNRTKTGFFGMYVDLKMGNNFYTFDQGDVFLTRTIVRVKPWQAYKMQEPGIVDNTTFPSVESAYSPNESFKISCHATAGGRVFAYFGGERYELEQQKAKDGFSTLYYKNISLDQKGSPRYETKGKIRYELHYKGKIYNKKSTSHLAIIGEYAPYTVEVMYHEVDSYENNSRNIGAHYLLCKGMKDYVTGIDNDLFRLSSGIWVRKSNLKIIYENLVYNRITDTFQYNDENNDYFKIKSNYTGVSYVKNNGDSLELIVANADMAKRDIVAQKTKLINGIKWEDRGSDTAIIFDINEEVLCGYYLNESENGVELVLRHKKSLADGNRPLTGITIMIDPGHGGRDIGGVALFGPKYSEKDIVLNYSHRLREKLEKLGADVIMTRVDDRFVSLASRLRFSKKYMPDLFVSIHADSMVETSDLNKIKGFSSFYKDPIAKELSERFSNTVKESTSFLTRGSKYANFYVVRGTWTPSVLVESGFVSNPNDLELIMDYDEAEIYINNLVDVIHEHFKQNN